MNDSATARAARLGTELAASLTGPHTSRSRLGAPGTFTRDLGPALEAASCACALNSILLRAEFGSETEGRLPWHARSAARAIVGYREIGAAECAEWFADWFGLVIGHASGCLRPYDRAMAMELVADVKLLSGLPDVVTALEEAASAYSKVSAQERMLIDEEERSIVLASTYFVAKAHMGRRRHVWPEGDIARVEEKMRVVERGCRPVTWTANRGARVEANWVPLELGWEAFSLAQGGDGAVPSLTGAMLGRWRVLLARLACLPSAFVAEWRWAAANSLVDAAYLAISGCHDLARTGLAEEAKMEARGLALLLQRFLQLHGENYMSSVVWEALADLWVASGRNHDAVRALEQAGDRLSRTGQFCGENRAPLSKRLAGLDDGMAGDPRDEIQRIRQKTDCLRARPTE